VLAQRDLLRGALFAGNVLEEFLDQVDVCEDHTAAAVSREADSVEGVAGRDDGLVGVIWRVEVVSRVIEGGGGGKGVCSAAQEGRSGGSVCCRCGLTLLPSPW
jgi:hypothetical protein